MAEQGAVLPQAEGGWHPFTDYKCVLPMSPQTSASASSCHSVPNHPAAPAPSVCSAL